MYKMSTINVTLNLLPVINEMLNDTGNSSHKNTTAEKVVIGVLLCILITVAIGGNALVCVAVLTDRRLKKNCNFFIMSLAIADLLVAMSVMTFAVPNDIQGSWAFGGEFCNIWISSDVMCSTASILNLCVISLDRYIHIKDPLHYDNWLTGRKTICFIATVWALSLLISFVPIHLGWHFNTNVLYNSESCVFEINPVYAVLSSTVSFYIPCIVMISIYYKLYSCARRHAQVIRKTQTFDKSSGYKASDHKAAITLGIIMGVFLLCWVPFFVMNPINAFCPSCIPPVVNKILTWLGYINSCLNPIIYSIFNQEFREAFRKILCSRCVCLCKCCCCKQLEGNTRGKGARAAGIDRSEYTVPVSGDKHAQNQQAQGRKNSREHLFSDRITSL